MNPTEGNPPLPDIKDIAGPETLPSVWETVALIAGIVIGVLLLAALIYFLYRKLVVTKKPPLTPLTIARRRVREIGGQIDVLESNAFSLALSDALKDYLSARFGDPLRYETSEEFLVRIASAQETALPGSVRDGVTEFLSVADEIKYGRPADGELRKQPLLEKAGSILGIETDSNRAVATEIQAG
ncbi:MAG: hypothetical protein KDN19_18435 [Verrucomicrobiae bacterium]|nr:hypothetical protein [Verrucomicrobiae bacterium]